MQAAEYWNVFEAPIDNGTITHIRLYIVVKYIEGRYGILKGWRLAVFLLGNTAKVSFSNEVTSPAKV